MKKYILLIIILFPFTLSATWEDSFIIYRKPLLSGLSLTQTDDTTSIVYRGEIIKTYRNEEFPTVLLPHGPDEDPDCYNSLVKNSPSSWARNIIGKEYLKSCLILQTKLIRSRYILFYAPSVEWNRVSIYDIRNKKFYHFIINTATSIGTTRAGGIIFLTRKTQSTCARSLILFQYGKTKTLFDDCTLTKSGWPMIEIQSYRILRESILVRYYPYKVVWYDSILDKTSLFSVSISLSWAVISPTLQLPPKNTNIHSWLLTPTIR